MNVSAQALSNACLNFANGQFSTKLQPFEVNKISEISSKCVRPRILMKFQKIYYITSVQLKSRFNKSRTDITEFSNRREHLPARRMACGSCVFKSQLPGVKIIPSHSELESLSY